MSGLPMTTASTIYRLSRNLGLLASTLNFLSTYTMLNMELAVYCISEINVVHTCKSPLDIFRGQMLEFNIRVFFFPSKEKCNSITLFFVSVFVFTSGNFELTTHYHVETATIYSVSTKQKGCYPSHLMSEITCFLAVGHKSPRILRLVTASP